MAEIDMLKLHIKDATIKISLKASSGYCAKVEGRISPYQWGEINKILDMPDRIPEPPQGHADQPSVEAK